MAFFGMLCGDRYILDLADQNIYIYVYTYLTFLTILLFIYLFLFLISYTSHLPIKLFCLLNLSKGPASHVCINWLVLRNIYGECVYYQSIECDLQSKISFVTAFGNVCRNQQIITYFLSFFRL